MKKKNKERGKEIPGAIRAQSRWRGTSFRHALHPAALMVGFLLWTAVRAPLLVAGKDKNKEPTRTLSGVILDEAENPIAGAAVTLKDLSNGKELSLITGEDGRYLFSALKLTRDYEVQATHKGVASRFRRVSIVDPRKRIVFDLQIPPPKEE